MLCEVEYTDEFEIWWNQLTVREQEDVRPVVRLLEERGTRLGHPYSSKVNRFYEHYVQRADAIYDQYLRQLRREGLLEPERGWDR